MKKVLKTPKNMGHKLKAESYNGLAGLFLRMNPAGIPPWTQLVDHNKQCDQSPIIDFFLLLWNTQVS